MDSIQGLLRRFVRLADDPTRGHWQLVGEDIIAHVTWWEEEALKHLPLIIMGGRPPRYSVKYGGIDAFNALMTKQKRGLSLFEVLREQDETHRRLIIYVQSAPEELLTRETRFPSSPTTRHVQPLPEAR
jgi:hypothetical protein